MTVFDIVQLQTVSLCTGKCVFCPHKDSFYAKTQGWMDYTLFNKIIVDLHENHTVKKICPYLMNEPFVDNTIELRTDIISHAFPKAMIEVSTNMLLCTPDRGKNMLNILEKHPGEKEIMISHHGVNKESFSMIMGMNYERTLDNIIQLIRINDGRIPIKIRGLGCSRDEKKLFFTPDEYLVYWGNIFMHERLNVTNIKIDSYGTFHSRAGNVNLNDWNYDMVVRKIDAEHHFDCWRLDKSLQVDFGGLVTPCCMPYNREYVLGDLNTQTVEEVMASEKYHEFVDKARGKVASDDDFICKKCSSPGG